MKSAAALPLASKPSVQVVYFFKRFWQQGWALAHSQAQHVNKPSPDVQHVWFGWYWGLGRFPYVLPLLFGLGEKLTFFVRKFLYKQI